MENLIDILKEYYNIEITDYQDYKEGIIFYANGNYYYFTKCHFNEEQLNKILPVCNFIEENGIKIHDFIYNKEYKLLSNDYILLKLNEFIDKITFKDVLLFSSVDCNSFKNDYVYMAQFWEEKIDYLELQLSELSNNLLLNNSFDYFVGIAEILLEYLKRNYSEENIDLKLSHRCLNCLDSIEYYNPLNISFDLAYKDIAAYLRKSKDIDLTIDIIDKAIKDSNYKYFFVRMVFPFDYFYEIQEILIEGKDNYDLLNIINNVEAYEKYLLNMEKLFGIYLFDWLKP